MLAIRILLQIVIVAAFLLTLAGFLIKPTSAVGIGYMIGTTLFFVLLFVATLSIGERKQDQRPYVLGYAVNPKTFGPAPIVLGLFMLFSFWAVMFGHPQEASRGIGPVAGLVNALFALPALLIPVGLGMVWHGAKLIRSSQPNNRKRRTREGETRAGDAER